MTGAAVVRKGGHVFRSPMLNIYTLTNCPFCMRAKTMLDKQGIHYVEHSIEGDAAQQRWVIEQSGGRKVLPQFFVDERHLGGYYELKRICQDGTLPLLIDAV